jgi:hypothetical protein
MIIISENQHKKTSKLILNRNAVRFKQNIEEEIAKIQCLHPDNGPKKKTLGRTKDAGVKAGARYECIYKNLLRDIR